MAGGRLPVRGGPADGARVRSGPLYGWIDPGTERVHTDPGAGRHLYRLRSGVYVHVHFSTVRCAGCGGFRLDLAGAVCPLCGEADADRGEPEPKQRGE